MLLLHFFPVSFLSHHAYHSKAELSWCSFCCTSDYLSIWDLAQSFLGGSFANWSVWSICWLTFWSHRLFTTESDAVCTFVEILDGGDKRCLQFIYFFINRLTYFIYVFNRQGTTLTRFLICPRGTLLMCSLAPTLLVSSTFGVCLWVVQLLAHCFPLVS